MRIRVEREYDCISVYMDEICRLLLRDDGSGYKLQISLTLPSDIYQARELIDACVYAFDLAGIRPGSFRTS
jgi:hypothetical protein